MNISVARMIVGFCCQNLHRWLTLPASAETSVEVEKQNMVHCSVFKIGSFVRKNILSAICHMKAGRGEVSGGVMVTHCSKEKVFLPLYQINANEILLCQFKAFLFRATVGAKDRI